MVRLRSKTSAVCYTSDDLVIIIYSDRESRGLITQALSQSQPVSYKVF